MVIKIDEQLNAHLKDNLFVLIGMRKLVYQIREKEDHRSAELQILRSGTLINYNVLLVGIPLCRLIFVVYW